MSTMNQTTEEAAKFPALLGEALADITLDPAIEKEIKLWTTYTQYLAAFAGVVRTVDAALALKLHGDTYKKIDGSLRALYAAVQGVDNEFVQGIADMKSTGKQPTYSFDPIKVPDWPDPTSGSSAKGIGAILEGVWDTVKPILEVVLGKIQASSSPTKAAFETAVVGLINAGDKVIDELKKAFS